MKNLFKIVSGMILVIFLTTAYSAAPKPTEFAPDYSALIEVCGRSVAYVPPGTRFVTCQGRVMRVLGIVPKSRESDQVESQAMGDCYCPRCCGGACAVIVNCDGALATSTGGPDCGAVPAAASPGDLCVLYLACGD